MIKDVDQEDHWSAKGVRKMKILSIMARGGLLTLDDSLVKLEQVAVCKTAPGGNAVTT